MLRRVNARTSIRRLRMQPQAAIPDSKYWCNSLTRNGVFYLLGEVLSEVTDSRGVCAGSLIGRFNDSMLDCDPNQYTQNYVPPHR